MKEILEYVYKKEFLLFYLREVTEFWVKTSNFSRTKNMLILVTQVLYGHIKFEVAQIFLIRFSFIYVFNRAMTHVYGKSLECKMVFEISFAQILHKNILVTQKL